MSVFFNIPLDVTVTREDHAFTNLWVVADPLAVAPNFVGQLRVHHLDVSLSEAGHLVDFQFGRNEVYDRVGIGSPSRYFGGVMGQDYDLPCFMVPSVRGSSDILGTHYLEGVGEVLSLDFPDPVESIKNHDIGGADMGFAIYAQTLTLEESVQMRVNVWAEVYR